VLQQVSKDHPKLIERFFVLKEREAKEFGWLCRSCHKPLGEKIGRRKPKFYFRLADYLKDGEVEVKHEWCA